MEKDYVETLLNDISKSYSSEEKIHLLTVFVTELAKSDAESKKAISEINDTIMLTTEAVKTLTKSIELATHKFGEIEKHMTDMSKALLETTEGAASTGESVNRMLNHLVDTEEMLMSLNERVTKLYEII